MKKKVAVVVQVISIEVEATGFKAMLAPRFSILLSKCLMKRLEMSSIGSIAGKILGVLLFEIASTIWCSYLLEDFLAIFQYKLTHSSVHKF